ncbi:MAG: SUMF1/EgtB/PvdO family nonheme iron enzyme [Lewinellaceae bacterium]|nr:SUMF1/EgtB/PvdO family nonheme iron enzyme [Lewinellaceae bacterium]
MPARGGPKSRNFKYAGGNKLEEVGWYGNNTEKKSYPVGSKKANELGVFDMSGNVWEWCSDWYVEYNLGKITINNPQGPEKGDRRALRGGSWLNDANSCRVANRNDNAPTSKGNNLGFRLARPY